VTTRPGPAEGWSTYMRDWRGRHRTKVEENRSRQRAYGRARSRLAEAHPTEFDALYEEEKMLARLEWEAEKAAGL
jgi:hypothetical protein